MSKSIMLSIKPRFVAKILNGEKTIEVRKSKPNVDLPIDVYIYCTKSNYLGFISKRYVGKVVAKFTLKKLYLAKYQEQVDGKSKLANKLTCLTDEELDTYLNKKDGYGWGIDDLVIFDKPKDLSEFYKVGYEQSLKDALKEPPYPLSPYLIQKKYALTKAPQSWCYIESEN